MKKKQSPILAMTRQILDEVQDHNVLVHGHKDIFIKLLRQIEWNLIRSDTFHNANSGQALGLVRGALLMFGQEPQGK